MIDPYQMLGVTRKSSTADIKKSYRRLAKELHPDRHPGDGRAAERFKEVASSYSLLNDPAKRARFDRGEIDGQGNERRYRRGQARPGPRARRPGAAGAGASPGAGRGAGQGAGQADEAGPFESFSFENFGFGGFSGEDVFSPFFGNRGNNSRRAQARAQARSLDSRYSLSRSTSSMPPRAPRASSSSKTASPSRSPSRPASKMVRPCASRTRAVWRSAASCAATP